MTETLATEKRELDEATYDVQNIIALMDLSEEEASLVKKASDFAKEKHKDHYRLSGDPYYVHLYETALSLAELGMGPRTISAGFLHDCLEDAGVSEEELLQAFGSEILFLVQGVTKLGTLRYQGVQRHAESLRRLFVATSQDLRVLMIKLMDRRHNISTLEYVRPDKQKRIAQETLEIYAPVADRLGMGRLKRELEDFAFQYTDPEEYKEMAEYTTVRGKARDKDLEGLLKDLKKEFAKHDVQNFRTEYRIKGLYSLYKKLQRKQKDIEQIHDILAVRIIVTDISDCYRVLGVVHSLWRPLPGKIKDYIAFPKPNGYRSIHTTIIAGKSGIVEIQIRTEEMHREAQFGVASHLSYKSVGSHINREQIRRNTLWFSHLIPSIIRSENKDTQKAGVGIAKSVPDWIRDIAETHQEEGGAEKFIEGLKSDFFSYRVFVFTPNGDVIDLPVDSSPIDFAYAIHSDIGNHISGVKVNGKLAPFDTKLKNGDIVEIETKESSNPTRKWLEYAKTSLARRHITNVLSRLQEQ